MQPNKRELQFEQLFNKSLRGLSIQVDMLLTQYARDLAYIYARNPNKDIKINKGLQKALTTERRKFYKNYNELLQKYSLKAERLSIRKHTEYIEAYKLGIGSDVIKKWVGKPSGINLNKISKRVWKLTAPVKSQITNIVNAGMWEGLPANDIANNILGLLRNPASLDISELSGSFQKSILKRNVKKYHPGRGVYKSARKNAYRLARTEVNRAYRLKDSAIRKELPFIIGVEVKLSGSHPREDICDDMTGLYPKDYIFAGWHPSCICYSVPKLATKKQASDIIRGDKVNINPRKRIPTKAKNYIKSKKDKIKGLKTEPYFISDNPKFFKDLLE